MSAALTKFMTTKQATVLLLLSRQRLAQLEGEGRLQRAGPDRWPIVPTVNAYVRLLRDMAQVNTGAANNRLREARAAEIELRTAESLGKLCPISDLEDFVDLVGGSFRTELGSLPARVTRDLTMRRIIEREVNAVLTRVANICVANAARLEKKQS